MLFLETKWTICLRDVVKQVLSVSQGLREGASWNKYYVHVFCSNKQGIEVLSLGKMGCETEKCEMTLVSVLHEINSWIPKC